MSAQPARVQVTNRKDDLVSSGAGEGDTVPSWPGSPGRGAPSGKPGCAELAGPGAARAQPCIHSVSSMSSPCREVVACVLTSCPCV